MKAIVTLIFIILIGFTANAQDASKEVKVATVTYGVELNLTIEKATTNQVARLYMYKNSRVKKALSFKTKRNKSKMA